MKKYLDADSAYEILDNLFAKIQKNNYVATEEMLNEAWNNWVKLPNALNLFEMTTRIKSAADENMKISCNDVISIIADEEKNCASRTCKFCGKSRRETTVFPVVMNGERIFTCQECISKQKDVKSLGFEYPLSEWDGNADKKVELYVHFLKSDLFGNAQYAKVSYTYENEIDINVWKLKAKVGFIASALGLEEDEVLKILRNETDSRFNECFDVYESIEFCTKEEYEK